MFQETDIGLSNTLVNSLDILQYINTQVSWAQQMCCEYTNIFPFSHLFKSLLLFWYLFVYYYLNYIILDTIHHIEYLFCIEYVS